MEEFFKRSPIASAALSVVLTVPESSSGWEAALNEWVTYLNGLERETEIVLVSERPELSLDVPAAKSARVRALPAPAKAGFGLALQTGLQAATKPLVLYGRCDGSYKPKEIQKLPRQIDQRDIVAGTREDTPGTKPPRGPRWIYRLFVRILFGLRVPDPGCLFLLARRHIFVRIPIQSAGVFAHVEVLAKANFLGCLMVDTPVAPQPSALASPRLREVSADARRVFFHPDFGPPEAKLDLIAGGVEPRPPRSCRHARELTSGNPHTPRPSPRASPEPRGGHVVPPANSVEPHGKTHTTPRARRLALRPGLPSCDTACGAPSLCCQTPSRLVA